MYKPAICSSYASERWQNNLLIEVRFEGEVSRRYLIDVRISRIINCLFKPQDSDTSDDTHQVPSYHLLESINRTLFDKILYFYTFATLLPELRDSTVTKLAEIASRCHLSALSCFIATKGTSDEADPGSLELSALQQNEEAFFKKSMTLLEHDDNPSLREVSKYFSYFRPENLQKMMMRAHRSDEKYKYLFVRTGLEAYYQSFAIHVEDLILQFTEQDIRLYFLSKIQNLDMLLLWYRQLKSNRNENLTIFAYEKILLSLIQENRFKEAFGFYLELINDKMLNNDQLTQYSQALSWNMQLRGSELESSKTLWIKNYISSELLYDLHTKKQCFLKVFTEKIGESLQLKPQSSTFLTALNRYIDVTVDLAGKYLNFYFGPEVPASEASLHPCLLDDSEILTSLASLIRQDLQLHFPTELAKAYGIDEKIEFQIEVVQRYAKTLYRVKNGIVNEYIVQFVSDYMQPFILGHITKEEQLPPLLLIQMEEGLKKAGIANCLQLEHVELAFYIYIRKAIDSFNFNRYYPLINRAPLYCGTENAQAFEKMNLTLHTAIKRDFEIKWNIVPNKIKSMILHPVILEGHLMSEYSKGVTRMEFCEILRTGREFFFDGLDVMVEKTNKIKAEQAKELLSREANNLV